MAVDQHIQRAEEIKSRTGRAIGAFKRAALLAGISLDEYLSRVSSGQKRCTICKEWKAAENFRVDDSRWDHRETKCSECKQRRHYKTYKPKPIHLWAPKGPPRNLPREGDKIQARHLINLDVRMGHRPNPNDLHCAACGHKGQDRRHEYHHHMGYAARHHYDVIPVCSTCHHEEH